MNLKSGNILKMRLLIAVFLTLIVVWEIFGNISKAPMEEFKEYHTAFKEAYDLQAYDYSQEMFLDAVNLSINAYEKLQYENERCIFVRDYSELRNMILLATSIAQEAKEKAIQSKIIKNK